MFVFVRCSRAIPFFALLGFAMFLTPSTAQGTSVSFCVGDCDGNGMVTVDELIRGINIALGNRSVDDCLVFDSSADGFVTVDEIVTAVANGLNGCPSTPTVPATAAASATPTATIGAPATPTATASAAPEEKVRVLITTNAPFTNPDTIVTSLGTPIISPLGFVFAVAQLTANESETQEILLRFSQTGTASVVLSQGQPIPGSSDTIESIGQINAKDVGAFARVDSAAGASLLKIHNDGTIESVLGIGAAGSRAEFEPRFYVVPIGGGSVVCDVFAPGANRAVVAVPLGGAGAPIPLVAPGDTVSYRNDAGDLVDDTVGETFGILAEDGAGVVHTFLHDAFQAEVEFSFDDVMLLDRHAALVTGIQAPGLDPGVKLLDLGGVRIGAMAGAGTRGVNVAVSEVERPGFDESAILITDRTYSPLFVLRSGDPVPDIPESFVDVGAPPAMGQEGAAVPYVLVDSNENSHPAIAFIDYQTLTFRTLVVAGQPAPGGGIITDLPGESAISETGQLVFLGRVDGNKSAYYAVSTSAEGATPRRLVGTGDSVALPEGGSAAITALGVISVLGSGGEAAVVNDANFTITAGLDGVGGAILLIDLNE